MTTTNEILNKVNEGALGGFNAEVITQHWKNIIGIDKLQFDETVRLVIMPRPESRLAKASKNSTGSWTDSTQIRSASELHDRLIEVQGSDPAGSVGFALSAGIYTYNKNRVPGYQDLKYIQNMIIDVDAHEREGVKDRFNISTLEPHYIRYMAVSALGYVNKSLSLNGLPAISPNFVSVTGGGFQFGVKFDKPLNQKTGRQVFETFGAVLGDPIVNKRDLENKEKAQELSENAQKAQDAKNQFSVEQDKPTEPGFQDSKTAELLSVIKKKKGVTCFAKNDFGHVSMPFLEIDASFKDLVHAQRIPGTINQKYDAYAYIDTNFFSAKLITTSLEAVEQDAGTLSNVETRRRIADSIKKVKHYYTTNMSKGKETMVPTLQPSEYIQTMSKIVQVANNEQERKKGQNISDLTGLEVELLKKIPDIETILAQLNIQVVKKSERFLACRSPFREDVKPSLAIYVNGDANNKQYNIMDFTENKYYNVITLWQAVMGITKTEAVQGLSEFCGISLEKGNRKEFTEIQNEENVVNLMKKIEAKDIIYYRMASMRKKCKHKNILTGETHTFDGVDALADHILKEQLDIFEGDKPFKKQFAEQFEQHILIDAFERFIPGQDVKFRSNNIRYVNSWVPSTNYRECHEEAKNLSMMDLPESAKLIKETCPNMYLYLLQLTQKGSLSYFIHWMASIAQFKIMPTIPIFSSVQGTGKNMFVENVLNFYLNQEYINVVDGKALQSNFNSFMATTNLIVADEGDFTGSKEFDQLKLLTGNNRIRVEPKGMDAIMIPKQFNIMMFTNGECPMRHDISDRRCNYYRLEHKLEHTLAKLGMEPEEYFEKIKEEVVQFWAILIKTKLKKTWQNGNFKNGQYHKQLFLMHPFGKFILKVIDGEWKDISVQLNEKIKDDADVSNNMQLLEAIKSAFFAGEGIQLTLINRYLEAMNWRSTMNIQDFIKKNNLQEHGLKIILHNNSVSIAVDLEKIQKFIYQENNLAELIPEYSIGPIKTMEDLIKQDKMETAEEAKNLSSHREAPAAVVAPTQSAPVAGNMPGLATPNPANPVGNMPGGAPQMPGIPGGAPNMPNMPGAIPGGAPAMPQQASSQGDS